jgi:hypothetical protein
MSPASESDEDGRIPVAMCPTCDSQMWLAMAPPKSADGFKEDWLFHCRVCDVIVPVAQT